MQVQLEVVRNNANVRKVLLRSDVLIGRSAECNLRVASSEVSRKHCRIVLSAGRVTVEDLGSSNGTFVDGRRIDPHTDVALLPGSRLAIGGVEFVVQFDAPAAPAVDSDSTIDLVPDETAPVRGRSATNSDEADQADTEGPLPFGDAASPDTCGERDGESHESGAGDMPGKPVKLRSLFRLFRREPDRGAPSAALSAAPDGGPVDAPPGGEPEAVEIAADAPNPLVHSAAEAETDDENLNRFLGRASDGGP